MGDSAQFHFGKKTSGDGLEFVGSKKPSLFAQYTAQFDAPVAKQRATQPQEPPKFEFHPAQEHPYAQVQPTYDQPPAEQAYPTQQDQFQDLSTLIDEEDDVVGDIPSLKIRHPKKGEKLGKLRKDGTPKPSKTKVVFSFVGMSAVVAVLAVSTLFLLHNRPAVSSKIRSKAGFPIYDVIANSLFTVDKGTVEINSSGSLVYIIYQKDNNAKFVVSQQAVPAIVKEDPQYQQFLADTDKFASFDSPIGKAYFTKPANIGNDISVVVKTDSTLMFIRGDGTTSEESWMNLLAYLKK